MGKGTVIYVGGFEMPDKNAAAHRVMSNGKILREIGYNVVFLGISHSIQTIEKTTYADFDCWSVPYPNSLTKWMKYLCDISMIKKLVSIYHDIKGVIFYNYQSVALWRAMRFCKKNKWFCIADATEWYVTSKENIAFYLIKKADTKLRMKALQPRMDGIIAISEYLANYYRKFNCKVIEIPPLVDLRESKWHRENEDTFVSSDKLNLVYAGTTSELKDNLNVVLEALKCFSNQIMLHIVGDIKIDSELQNSVVAYGRLNHNACIDIIRCCDFQIFLREDNLVTKAGFPTKLVESFACGTPVITNANSNIINYLDEGNNSFLVKSLSIEDVSEVFKKVISLDKDDILKMKQNCRENENFSYENYISQFKDFICEYGSC